LVEVPALPLSFAFLGSSYWCERFSGHLSKRPEVGHLPHVYSRPFLVLEFSMARIRTRYTDASCIRAAAMAAKPLIAIPGELVIPWKVVIGPYLLSVRWADETTMQTKRLLAEACPNHQVIRLSKKLSGVKLARYFLRSVIHLILYTSGLNSRKVDEEQATHLLATGLVALIVHNPEVWAWFNGLVTRHLRLPRPKVGVSVTLPRAVCLGRNQYSIEPLSHALAERLSQWGDIDLNSRTVRLSEELRGTHLAVIFWHELLHGIHKECGLRGTANRDTAYLRAQADGIIGFIRKNPLAWRWFVSFTRNAATAQDHVSVGARLFLGLAA
jgi:hypothetical protein